MLLMFSILGDLDLWILRLLIVSLWSHPAACCPMILHACPVLLHTITQWGRWLATGQGTGVILALASSFICSGVGTQKEISCLIANPDHFSIFFTWLLTSLTKCVALLLPAWVRIKVLKLSCNPSHCMFVLFLRMHYFNQKNIFLLFNNR